ncbi:uncharacterized protein SOCE26_006270 [Sorangium cellulosum]|uniref:Uncharacterized protein n=1 Tax=Sorangium cellulosum TaxID=56 RepID=A0A2L0EIW7_SORCE|nr:hypothetical protein [Sorangium cellulosum]AUX39243.1 uncharacterized protein SOCE26_006270 [Sorangium cellulosum]
MALRPEDTAPRGQPDAEHHRLEDRHGGPDGVRHHLEEERLERLVRAAQGASEQAERERRHDVGRDGTARDAGAARTASLADIERADDEGMLATGVD